jgi:hypothetical protein
VSTAEASDPALDDDQLERVSAWMDAAGLPGKGAPVE